MLTRLSPPSADIATARWEALGTTVIVRITKASALVDARALVESELDAVDRACSRFPSDSELERVNASAGRFLPASPLFLDALAAGLRAASLTGGAVDPTLGEAIVLAGYSSDFSDLERAPAGPPGGPGGGEERAPAAPPARPARGDERAGEARPIIGARRASGWKLIEISDDPPGVRLPAGIRLDLGRPRRRWPPTEPPRPCTKRRARASSSASAAISRRRAGLTRAAGPFT